MKRFNVFEFTDITELHERIWNKSRDYKKFQTLDEIEQAYSDSDGNFKLFIVDMNGIHDGLTWYVRDDGKVYHNVEDTMYTCACRVCSV